MPKINKEQETCQICGNSFPLEELAIGASVRENIVNIIKKTHPKWSDKGYICLHELNGFRHIYVENILEEEYGELSKLEKEVLAGVNKSEIITENVEEEIEEKITFGQKIADKVAIFGGSWTFIISFFLFLAIWVSINTYLLLKQPFDPYPFILLNLFLSCLAALQAPVILMSQNRQASKDRIRSENDYKINLKAELEIRQIHEKIDHMLIQQSHKLLEIQDIQLEFMKNILQKVENNGKKS